MDISLSTVTSQASLSQSVGIALTKKAMDAAQTKNDALVKMMEQSVKPNLGRNIDLKL